jgi:hypothetical protein
VNVTRPQGEPVRVAQTYRSPIQEMTLAGLSAAVRRAERAGVPGEAGLRFTRKREALFEWTETEDPDEGGEV